MNRCGPERGIHSATAPTRHRKRNKFRAPGFNVPMHAQKRKEAFHEPRRSRLEEALISVMEQVSLLTSAPPKNGEGS